MTTQAQHSAGELPLSPTDLLTPDQVAATLGLSHRTLAAWRSSRRNPLPYVKVGTRVRYRRQDVAAWLESRRILASGQ
ncbi:TPA: helix-turn-helix domain-containing protein [Pseudomonas aeruginosa]|uniref:DNA-binding protein n=1 Tax=Pseudomonas aeruginosa TaxID=287 RepID=A0ABD7K9D0_PSEAI|nr:MULTISPECIES: helix-turn-helix domain-containing protein [Pseudomonas aeruginosa group]MBG4707714.1 helix-turn-helix domain-containing protein [Pseudomonas aeruginosa]MBG5227048.1 helix-turn-helix domain-containing protein [Pseudomonas aeruginosa]MBG6503338.1 helix-turn-helix domain-containing protein [Pseudomonas aeruginosa]MBH8769401.1 helix-turn-helix domain-containing protein [Pseudomonas aeruginosa]MBH9130805.1 helix-turn-helix domain-containing protein [Pseudomonas aeruginosa]